MTNLEKVLNFFEEAKILYLTTVNGDKPKCRPVSFFMEVDGRIYFGVGTHKEVYKQLTANQNVEFCACKGSNFIRYYGKAIVDTNPALTEKAIEVLPFLKDIYNEESGLKLGIFSLENATAEFYNMMGIEESIKF